MCFNSGTCRPVPERNDQAPYDLSDALERQLGDEAPPVEGDQDQPADEAGQ